ncbi:tyrosine-type recombinase/integrase [Pseudomonas alliivorans]|nr:tyrosine-type recombinase/integrase [Pseudomonas alliivorans]MEE4873585.1 tyrosine-type recombinase/integrase [Pseudomonas alliivorans]
MKSVHNKKDLLLKNGADDDAQNTPIPINSHELAVSCVEVEGQAVVTSWFDDNEWWLEGIPTNQARAMRIINFSTTPEKFRLLMKTILFRYLKHGRAGLPPPKGASVKNLYEKAKNLFIYFESIKIYKLADVTPLATLNYIEKIRSHKTWKGQGFSKDTLVQQFLAIEAVYELSQYTDDRWPVHPWPDSSAAILAEYGTRTALNRQAKTPLMPDGVFCKVFERAHNLMEAAPKLLDFRDACELQDFERCLTQAKRSVIRNDRLRRAGWNATYRELATKLLEIRTACYVILASTSGCRNHELANLSSGALERTVDADGNVFHWMKSRSEKTDAGVITWMIPEVAVRALRLMERWAIPYQSMIKEEIRALKSRDPFDPAIAEVIRHKHCLFLGKSGQDDNHIRTLSLRTWATSIRKFGKDAGIEWRLSTHQFRRKFANYAAHSKFGDLRYLRQHFAHWSMDMTLPYAMDDGWGAHLDTELLAEIDSELINTKIITVDKWLAQHTLSGGCGSSLKAWQRNPDNLTLFKSHAAMVRSLADNISIRSNGHAWCTADSHSCVGNGLERTRCGECLHGVIGAEHAHLYRGMQEDLRKLLDCKDIGEAGIARVNRDLNRCIQVIEDLEEDRSVRKQP